MNKLCTTCKWEPDWRNADTNINLCQSPVEPKRIQQGQSYDVENHSHVGFELEKRQSGVYQENTCRDGGTKKITCCDRWEAKGERSCLTCKYLEKMIAYPKTCGGCGRVPERFQIEPIRLDNGIATYRYVEIKDCNLWEAPDAKE